MSMCSLQDAHIVAPEIPMCHSRDAHILLPKCYVNLRNAHGLPSIYQCFTSEMPMCHPWNAYVLRNAQNACLLFPRYPCVSPEIRMCFSRDANVFFPEMPICYSRDVCFCRDARVLLPRCLCVTPEIPMCFSRDTRTAAESIETFSRERWLN